MSLPTSISALACVIILMAASGQSRAELRASTLAITLPDSFAGHQILVESAGADATRKAAYSSKDSKVAKVDSRGYVSPAGNGSTAIVVSLDGQSLSIPVEVKGYGDGRKVDFRTEVQPLLSKLGCNAGGCHGKASGQNGFKLSLFGFDSPFDHAAIVKEARGRRLMASSPDKSLFLLKATGQVPHGGGRKLKPESPEYSTLLQWIVAGAPYSAPDVPTVTRLSIVVADRVMTRDQTQQLAVLAHYSDGTRRDVTRQSEFAGNLDVVASVDSEGLVRAGANSGEAAIMARHMGHVAVFRALVPHAPPLASIDGFQPATKIDELVMSKWKRLGLKPSPVCDDSTFLRRLTVDLAGRLPTVEETRAFLSDNSADKRTKAVDRLLDGGDYPAYFAMKWGSILRNSNLAGAEKAAYAFHNWIKDSISRNKPYDEFVRGIVAAAGEWPDSPAINWYWQNRDDQLHQTTADVAQIFLGIRLQCAKCHHHPYERWGQADYYGLAGFFTRLGRKSFGEPPPYFSSANATTGERDPLTGKVPEPKYPDGAAPKFSPEEDPRHALVDWMVRPDNPFFAKALSNRLWGHFFGRGIVQEVDDLRETNPPSNPELLDHLAGEFLRSKFNMKALIRQMLVSRVYQLSSEPTGHNRTDAQNFARYYARRMPAEVFHDAVNQVCESRQEFNGMPRAARAVDLPHENFGSYFLDVFDRPKRVSVCECERSTSATLAQVLLLSNSEEMENKVASGEGRVARMIKAGMDDSAMVEELFLAARCRLPSPKEKQRAMAHLAGAEKAEKAKALEDIVWALLNTRDFVFNH
ncbi:MAG: DUF1549 and DUF1553 domain-containing protein [Planctomycetota bacterium]